MLTVSAPLRMEGQYLQLKQDLFKRAAKDQPMDENASNPSLRHKNTATSSKISKNQISNQDQTDEHLSPTVSRSPTPALLPSREQIISGKSSFKSDIPANNSSEPGVIREATLGHESENASQISLPEEVTPSNLSHPLRAQNQSANTFGQTIQYLIIGGVVLFALSAGFTVWVCFKKRKKRSLRNAAWEDGSESSWKYNPNMNDCGLISEKQFSGAYSFEQNETLPIVVSKRSWCRHAGFKNNTVEGRESKLWGTSKPLEGSENSPENFEQDDSLQRQAFYSGLDFGPLVNPRGHQLQHAPMSYTQKNQPIQADGNQILIGKANELDDNNRSQQSALDTYRSGSHEIAYSARYSRPPKNLHKSKTIAYRDPERSRRYHQMITSPSLDGLNNTTFHSPDISGTRWNRKKDTIVGLTDAYGNVNGWGGVEQEPLPAAVYQPQTDATHPGCFSAEYSGMNLSLPYLKATNQPAIPLPVATSRHQTSRFPPQQSHLKQDIPKNSCKKHKMSPAEASDELKNVLKQIDNTIFHPFQQNPSQNSIFPGVYSGIDKSSHNLEENCTVMTTIGDHSTGSLDKTGQHPSLGIIYEPSDQETTSWKKTSDSKTKYTQKASERKENFLPFIKPSPPIVFPGFETVAPLLPSSFTLNTSQHGFNSPSSYPASPVVEPHVRVTVGEGSQKHTSRKDVNGRLVPSAPVIDRLMDDPYQGIDVIEEEENRAGTTGIAQSGKNYFAPLSQMNLEAIHPNYRSATLSVYDMYNKALVYPNLHLQR